jgi:hypothetical protein
MWNLVTTSVRLSGSSLNLCIKVSAFGEQPINVTTIINDKEAETITIRANHTLEWKHSEQSAEPSHVPSSFHACSMSPFFTVSDLIPTRR